jgi:hypothetical protein
MLPLNNPYAWEQKRPITFKSKLRLQSQQ